MKYFLLFLLFLSGAAYGQPAIADLKLNQQLSILNDKAFFLFPDAAANVARQSDIMAADPNTERETRIMMDIGEKRLVFFAEELYATAGDNLVAGIRSNQGKHAAVKLLERTDGLVAVLATPQTFDTTQDAILINSLVVKAQDQTLFRINAFINPRAFGDREAFRELSERVFRSLTKGRRTLNLKAGTKVVPVLNGSKMFRVRLPEGYVISKDQKYDFEVLRFLKVKDFFDTTWSNFTVYLGHYPSFFYRDYNFSKDRQERAAGIFLGKNRDWMFFKNEGQHIYLKEQQFPADELDAGLIIHIALAADHIKTLEELAGIVATINFEDK